jgi:hypothetical protein
VCAGGSFGGGRAAFHLRQIGVFLDLHFINKPELHVKAYDDPPKFDADGNLIHAETRERLRQVLLSLQAFALRLQPKGNFIFCPCFLCHSMICPSLLGTLFFAPVFFTTLPFAPFLLI